MPLKLEKATRLANRSERVKSVELHPTDGWLLASLFSGKLQLFATSSMALARTIECAEVPVRCARFVASKQWAVAGSDDMAIRVFNYNTSALVTSFEAHADYIRSIAVHPSSPLLLSSADDMLIKLWDYDHGFATTMVFEGHSHFVMHVCFNPKDPNTFASASLDRTVKVWSLSQPTANFTLEGHEKGVNCVAYYPGPDKPYLASGSDDYTVKVWDYQTKAVVQSMEGHSHNVSAVAFHPELPLILSAGEDSKVNAWHSTTYRRETVMHSSYERPWSISVLKGSTNVAIGYDEGTQVIRLAKEEPAASMDSSGKVVYARHSGIMSVNVKHLQSSHPPEDGERLQLSVKELGSTDIYPQQLLHSPNGRFIAVCGDGEFVVYTALAFRSKTFGPGQDFAWGSDSSWFAVREQQSTMSIYKNFKKHTSFKPATNQIEGVMGGALLGLQSQNCVYFHDWSTGTLVRRVDLRDGASSVYWAESNELLAVLSAQNFFILQYHRQNVSHALEHEELGSNGVENTFSLLHNVSESVSSASWVGDCFIYTTTDGRLCYSIGGEVEVLQRLDRPMYLLGYLATQNKAYLVDKDRRIISYTLLLSVIEYKTLVIRGEPEQAEEALQSVPESRMDEIARFLHQRGMAEEALRHARDSDYRFQLATELNKLSVAKDEAEQLEKFKDSRLRQVGQLALKHGDFALAEECFERGNDISGLLLLHSSTGNVAKLEHVAEIAKTGSKHNVSFLASFLCNKPEECIQMLQEDSRYPEAAFMALSYCPSRTSDAVKQWKQNLAGTSARAASLLADPDEYPNLFPGFEESLQEEKQRKAVSVSGDEAVGKVKKEHAPTLNGDVGSASAATPAVAAASENAAHDDTTTAKDRGERQSSASVNEDESTHADGDGSAFADSNTMRGGNAEPVEEEAKEVEATKEAEEMEKDLGNLQLREGVPFGNDEQPSAQSAEKGEPFDEEDNDLDEAAIEEAFEDVDEVEAEGEIDEDWGLDDDEGDFGV